MSKIAQMPELGKDNYRMYPSLEVGWGGCATYGDAPSPRASVLILYSFAEHDSRALLMDSIPNTVNLDVKLSAFRCKTYSS